MELAKLIYVGLGGVRWGGVWVKDVVLLSSSFLASNEYLT